MIRPLLALPLIALTIPAWPLLVPLAWSMGMRVSWRTTMGDVCRYLGGKML